MNEQSLSYSTDIHLPPIIMECRPKLKLKETTTKIVISFFKAIENDFRQQYPNHKRPIGFDHWWQDNDGARLLGVIKDVDLFVYLYDAKRYPTKLENITILPDPPKRLPPQYTVIVKFVKNGIETDEIRQEIKERYKSTFTVENMMGAMRSNSRHIKVDFSDKKDYESILNSGIIGIQGQLFDVDEYLPAPKILICQKCNTPGHTKKQCQLSLKNVEDAKEIDKMVLIISYVQLNVNIVEATNIVPMTIDALLYLTFVDKLFRKLGKDLVVYQLKFNYLFL